ncbi:Ldh family oxidoreductase [Candidatus Saccharibacteria bacterium]|nr:MAG: Ldh family oxidoreductase [Candidatus Saccharibacteria bacterium]
MTYYGLVLAKARGETIPEHMAIDKDGKSTTDPAAAMDGALLSFDRSYKGSGFAMVVEALAGPLLGGAWVDNMTFKEEWGTIVMAIDPDLMVGREQFKENTSDMIAKIKSSRTIGDSSIRLPGESAQQQYEAAKNSGEVEIDDAVANEIGIFGDKS